MSRNKIRKSIRAAGFDENPKNWHISKHDVYGERFLQQWEDSVDTEVNSNMLEGEDTVDDLMIDDK